ncbi:MAG: bifunctional riboflavin kinase/FAD synthetase [Clostridia bacterium]|nr:bifunctional riboflavin kinase/FAD synthetase [Clostridia bacterium]
MSRWKGIETIEYTQPCDNALIIALGFFDCLHIGHTKLIQSAKLLAFKNGAKCGVFTFDNNPFEILVKDNCGQILNFEERLSKLDDLRVDYCIKARFDVTFSQLSPLDFLRKLSENKNIKGIVVGKDYKFGAKGEGDVELLAAWCDANSVELVVEPFAIDEGGKISSTRVRKLLCDGELEKANFYLGQPYFVIGQVEHGQQRGRNMGFATANVEYPRDKLKIKCGVYYTRVLVDGVWLKAVTNVGTHPTFDDMTFNIESHILFYKDDLYGKKITIKFLQRIRDIKKFTSKEELAERISKDVNFALESKQ